ncbi:MAG TPA: hypothetical protein VGK19_06100 [Capsulimonadaceae bacterium]|jgi:hypothetical protein
MFDKLRSIALPVVALIAAAGFAFTAPVKGAPPATSAPASSTPGVPVHFQLPVTGPLPKTYRVTLAIVDAKNPDWIISQFAAGVPCTVTAENQGKFTQTWNGLDDNFMPVPPGTYGVKGIVMPAEKWAVDGDYHTVTPRFVSGYSTWLPTPDQLTVPEPFGGDPVGSPLRDIDVSGNGRAVFYWQYLENGKNNVVVDLAKPLGYSQFVTAYGSGGAAGGNCTCTDGETIWSYSLDGGPKYIYRPDGKPWGTDQAQRPKVTIPTGWVKAMACFKDPSVSKSFVYLALGGKIEQKSHGSWSDYSESKTDFVDAVEVREGDGGKLVATVPVRRPLGIVTRGGTMYVLHQADSGVFEILSAKLTTGGIPDGPLAVACRIPATINPYDMERDSHGRYYVSDPAANKVYQLDAQGKITVTYGRASVQTPATYDPLTFMNPQKLGTWTDPSGADRLIVVEQAGPNRASEWSAEGKLLREFQTFQTKANDGYAIDPDHPTDIYLAGHEDWLTRFKLDYATGAWKIDAVWPNVGSDPLSPGFDHPKFVRLNGREYIACARSRNIYRREGNRWLLSAAIITKPIRNSNPEYYTWHDANGDGIVHEAEYAATPLAMPGRLLRYHGETWLDDLSELTLNWSGPDVWRLKPESFDAHGNPVFKAWEKVLTDSLMAAKLAGTADSLYGGNELDTSFSDWGQADGSPTDGYYVNSRGGYKFSANFAAQDKVSRYVPDGKGGYTLKWRTGREAMNGNAQPGEIYAAIRMAKPIGGVLSIVDQSRCGVILYTTDGMYIDTLFPDGRKYSPSVAGVYVLPEEFFAGVIYPNKDDGNVYIGMGKFTPMVFKAVGWSMAGIPVQPLISVDKSVTISAGDIATPPDIALFVRGGAGAARVARFDPATGGVNFDGGLSGWEGCKPITFEADKDQKVEVRALYDPTAIFLRWHITTSGKIEPKPLRPVERLFTHDRLSDTFSFYIQGDPNAKAASTRAGRPNDVRFVFGVFADGDTVKPVELGMYPTWDGQGKANPATYRTPVGKVDFAHVGLVEGAKLNYVPDPNGKGYVLIASIPVAALPKTLKLSGDLRTMVDFEATFGGHGKVWWANSDGSASRETYDEPTEASLYPGAWAPAQFASIADGLVVQNWLIAGPFGGTEARKYKGEMPYGEKLEAIKYFNATAFPPDAGNVDVTQTYSGEQTSGYWGERQVRWTPARVADMDNRVICGATAQVYYGASWVYAPEQTDVIFEYRGHHMTTLHYWLNGKETFTGYDFDSVKKPVTLPKGWSQVEFRGYCVGYQPFRAGLVIRGTEAALWSLKMQSMPPQ